MTILFWTHHKSAKCGAPDCTLQATFRWSEGPFYTDICVMHSYDSHIKFRSLASTLLVLEVS